MWGFMTLGDSIYILRFFLEGGGKDIGNGSI